MKKWIASFVVCMALSTGAGAGSEPMTTCTMEWYQFVEQKLVSGDGQGHGPDLGSDEWKSVVEFRLEIRGQADLPDRNSEEWCQLIDQLVRER